MTIEARWNGQVVARAQHTVQVEGNHYFDRADVTMDRLEPTDHSTHCPWKGDACYFDVVVDGERNANAAWTYTDPKPRAENIRDRIAFWKGVTVTQVAD